MVTEKTTMLERELELSRGGVKRNSLLIVSAVIVVSVALFLALSCNSQRPVITSLEADTGWIVPLGSLRVTCNASDPDGDELSYSWSASGGEINGEGAMATWTAPDSVGSYTVAVTVTDGHGADVTKQVIITVGANRAPYISNVVASADQTTPSCSLQVTCNATDPDGDQLSYEWSASSGSITGTNAVASWVAPEEIGMYDITVVVDDGRGGNVTRTIRLTVATGPPPVIEGLNVTAREPKYLKKTATGYKVGKTKQYDIECIASGTGTLSYNWTCAGGEISGGGCLVTWTAPDTEGDVTVVVKAFDDAGNWAERAIVFEVVPCSACLFG
jgi:hypothetical protein